MMIAAVLLLSLAQLSAGEPSTTLVFTVLNGRDTTREIDGTLSGDTCRLQLKEGKSLREIRPAPQTCQTLRRLTRKFLEAPQSRIRTWASDSPQYLLKVGDRREFAFPAPRKTCRLLPDGREECRDHALTPAQELAHLLIDLKPTP